MLTLDASHGEGGGQILRTALSLAVLLRRPIALSNVRVRRPKPGLQPQHLAVVRALASISDAEVTGDALGSTILTFAPRMVKGGTYRFDVGAVRGSAGSVSLLFQALLLPLAFAGTPSHLTLVGGTHVPWSPTVHYLTEVFLPPLRAVGLQASVALRRWGWYPRGGGEIDAEIGPLDTLTGITWTDPGSAPIRGVSAVSRLPVTIAERQRARALERLANQGLSADLALVTDDAAFGPGTTVCLWATGARSAGGSSAFGRRGVSAEAVADEAVDGLLAYLASGAAVDTYLADQLVPFLALGSVASTFTCPLLTSHLRTVAWVAEQLAGARITLDPGQPARVEISAAPRRKQQ
jgi:RNA 3'-terminal phosphate cyclase (ATP)